MHDIIIIGAGPAGLSAARWCDELGLDTLVLERAEEVGGQLLSVYGPIENYLGVRAANGRELRDRFVAQTQASDFDLWTNVELESVDLKAKRIALERGGAIKPFEMAVQGVLIRIGWEPNTNLIAGQLELDERGYVIVGSQQETSVANVFAIGDVANPLAPTIAGAVGAGATAAKVIAARLSH